MTDKTDPLVSERRYDRADIVGRAVVNDDYLAVHATLIEELRRVSWRRVLRLWVGMIAVISGFTEETQPAAERPRRRTHVHPCRAHAGHSTPAPVPQDVLDRARHETPSWRGGVTERRSCSPASQSKRSRCSAFHERHRSLGANDASFDTACQWTPAL